jgi:hypothetical protein
MALAVQFKIIKKSQENNVHNYLKKKQAQQVMASF